MAGKTDCPATKPARPGVKEGTPRGWERSVLMLSE
jgi:hypothetical protein